jgi:ATP-binding cassette, subfamily B, bacterial MsbA
MPAPESTVPEQREAPGQKLHLRTLWESVRAFPLMECARRMGLRKRHMAACISLAFCVALLDGAMLAMLVPVGRGIGTGDFSSFWKLPLVKDVLPEPRDVASTFLLLAACMFVLALAKNALTHGLHTLIGHLRERSKKNLAEAVFGRYLEFGKAFFDRVSAGRLATILEYRHDAVDIFQDCARLSSTLLILAAYLGVMLLISWRLTLFAVLLFPAVQFASRSILAESAKVSRSMKRSSLNIGQQVHRSLETIAIYQSSAQQGAALRSFSETVDQLGRSSRRLWQVRGLNARIQELTALAALLLMLGAAFLFEPDRAAQGVLMLVFFFVARLSLPMLGQIPDFLLDAAEKLPRAEELLRVFDDRDKYIVPSGPRHFEALNTEIRFENVSFAYPGGPPALREASFTLKKGQLTALVGPSGAGKSTVVQLLLRLYDVPPGAVRIDGMDIREFSTQSLRRGIAAVSQDAVVLPGTLRSNLLFGVERIVSEEEIRQAIADARLTDLAASQAEGLDLLIGEHSATLSGGERQRVAIARALLRRAPILILDEATSSLDAITEKLLQEAIHKALERTTALVVAHRFSTIRRADHVVVLNEGRVAEQGTVTDLLRQDGLFASMWRHQKFA